MDKTEPIEFIEDKVQELNNFLIQQDSTTKGSVKIDVNNDGSYDITVHKGAEMEATTIRSVDKSKLLEMLESRL
jgi:hypothetical protein